MTIEKIEGIIISETNYSESSKILNVITKEKGRIGILSKGCRSMKSKLRSVSSKLVYGFFHIYYKEDGLSTLISVDVIDDFKEIRSNIHKISYASFLMELTDQVLKQTNDDEIYPIFISGLKKMNENYDPAILTNIIELKYLNFLGVMPSVDGCSICGSSKSIVTIDAANGGYICKNCYTNEKIVSDKTVKLIRLFYYVDIEKISKLEVSSEVRNELDFFLDDYYDRYTGLYLKSKKFLKNLNRIG